MPCKDRVGNSTVTQICRTVTYRDGEGDCQGAWLSEVGRWVVSVDGCVGPVTQQLLCVEAAGQLPLDRVGVQGRQLQAVVAYH